MSNDEPLKWSRSKDHRVKDVEEAIELAEKFRQDGIYQWFRGQAKPWPPHTTLLRAHRLGDAKMTEVHAQLGRLEFFMKSHPELQLIADNENAFLAVAQHYGIPTPYLDFTTEPAIAGFFACDTKNPEVGSDSCIFCLNIDDIQNAWKALTSVAPKAKIETLSTPVPNLWRLESQHGVFLYCVPLNWDDWYEMDKIIFPYRGYPAYPPKEVVYPKEKSSLENLLDHFFAEEVRRKGHEELMRVVQVHLRADAPADFYNPEYFKGGKLGLHPSWGEEKLKEWEDSKIENFQIINRNPIRLRIDASWSPSERRRRVTTAVAGALRIHPRLRQSLVAWDMGDVALTPHADGNKLLREAIEWLWDGMRRLPYTDAQIASAVGVSVHLASLGLTADTPWKEQLTLASEVFGPSIEIEFGESYGSYSRAVTAEHGLRAAMRADLLDLASEQHSDQFQDAKTILLLAFSAQRVFDFDRLCALFAEQIVPWQVLARRGRAIFFAPSSLTTLGLP